MKQWIYIFNYFNNNKTLQININTKTQIPYTKKYIFILINNL